MTVDITRHLPCAALDDYAEYRRQGGRFDLDVWWDRYKDDYRRSVTDGPA